MDHFENIISTLLEAEGYWVRRSFKINVTKEEKRLIGKHSIPRPEIDLLAFKFSANEVLALEAKSFLDSFGVNFEQLQEKHEVPKGRYKLFTSENYRSIVLSRLLSDLVACGMADTNTKIILGLAAGKIYQNRSDLIREFMLDRNWVFLVTRGYQRKS